MYRDLITDIASELANLAGVNPDGSPKAPSGIERLLAHLPMLDDIARERKEWAKWVPLPPLK